MTQIRFLTLLCLALGAPTLAAAETQVPFDSRATPAAEIPASPAKAATEPRAPAGGDLRHLEARGPGAVFASIEAAAIDALTYAYLRARGAPESGLVRGGAIHPSGAGYSYDEIHVAKPLRAHRIAFRLKPRDVARFVVYPRVGEHDVDRANERPSRVDRRCVSTIDPLQRPLFILHPSLAIRAYLGEGLEIAEVANLRRPIRALELLAGN